MRAKSLTPMQQPNSGERPYKFLPYAAEGFARDKLTPAKLIVYNKVSYTSCQVGWLGAEKIRSSNVLPELETCGIPKHPS